MRRYVAKAIRPKAEWDDEYSFVPDLTVYEPHPEPIDTGLVDWHGTTIYAMDERDPIGFTELRTRA